MSFSYNPSEILTNFRQNKSFSGSTSGTPSHFLKEDVHQSIFKLNSLQNKPTIIITKEDSFKNQVNHLKAEEGSVILNVTNDAQEILKKEASADSSFNSNEKASRLINSPINNKKEIFSSGDHHLQHILTGVEVNNRSFQIINQNSPSGLETRETQVSPKSVKGDSEEIKGEMYKTLLDKIRRLETRVGTLEIELCQAKEDIQCLRMEKRRLEEEIVMIDLNSKGKSPYSPLGKRGSASPSLIMSKNPSPKLPKGSSKEEQDDFFSFNRSDTNKIKQDDFQKTIHEAVREKGVDQLIKRKEKKFISYTKKDTMRYNESRAAGKLKVEPLNEIRSFYPNMEKPIVLIRIKEKDLKT